MAAIRVTVWNEFYHERHKDEVRALYPQGIHGAIAEFLTAAGDFEVRTATLDEAEHGLSEDVLANTDVLLWWGHMAHDKVSDEVVARVHQQVLAGMGLIVLHSGHFSKIFKKVLGTHGSLRWREADEKERIWVLEPAHPIAEGLPPFFELPQEEMYGERFDIPTPDKLIMVSWFQGGDVFRSGCTWQRGHGQVFYFRPGHETYPTFYDANVQKVIVNACRWARRRVHLADDKCAKVPALEPVPNPDKLDVAGR